MPNIRFVYFGSSEFSRLVLKELADKGFAPILSISSAHEPLNKEALEGIDADVFIVASFGKILPDWLIYMPKFKTLNVHPSLLPKLRGPSPIQGAILSGEKTGVTIQRINEKMDEGPIVAQKMVELPENLGYIETEKILAKVGGQMLTEILPKYISGELKEAEQSSASATYTKMIKKEDADITNDSPEVALRKVKAYEVWPRARKGELVITKAHIEGDKFIPDRVIPPGKKEMDYKDYLRGNPKVII